MGRIDEGEPSRQQQARSTTRYGVYKHDLLDQGDVNHLQLIAKEVNRDLAYETMRQHAMNQIDRNPTWGATREVEDSDTFELIDYNNTVRLRYHVAAIHATGKEPRSTHSRTRVGEPVQNSAFPPARYAMYVEVNCDDDDLREDRSFIGGHSSLGEANHAMMVTAQAYRAGHSGTTVMEKSVSLLNDKGEVKLRYSIDIGRFENKAFIPESDWEVKKTRMDMDNDIDMDFPNTISTSPSRTFGAASSSTVPVPSIMGTAPLVHFPPPRTAPKPTYAPRPGPLPAFLTIHEALPSVNSPVWCTCRRPDDGLMMLECGNEDCPIEWYHAACVDVDATNAPGEDDEWLCPTCNVHEKNKGKGKRKRKAKGKGRASGTRKK